MKLNLILSMSTYGILSLTNYSQTTTNPSGANPSGLHSQTFWSRAGNTDNNGNNNVLGTRWNSEIWLMTNSRYIGKFSSNNGLYGLNGAGDGLRIHNMFTPGGGLGEIDIFTSSSNGTEIRFGGSGNIAGRSNRFEMWGNYDGLFFNASDIGPGIPLTKFATAGTINAFVRVNRYWRIGDQNDPTNLAAQTRLQVVDLSAQLRLTNAGPNVNSGFFTDFFANSLGNLQIQPSAGRVGINAPTNPTATIDVFGDARIRNVQAATPNSILIGVNAAGPSDVNVRRLDFTGNATDVLLGNGTWGPATTTAPLANNGVSRNVLFNGPYQLGDGYNGLPPFLTTNTPLTTNRQVRLGGNNLIFSGQGRIRIGLTFPVLPTEVIDVNGNGRFQTLPLAANQANASVTKYVMVDETGVLRWTNNIQSSSGSFGVVCTDNTGSDFTTDKHIELENNSFYFSDGNSTTQLGENRVGIGYDCGTVLPGKVSVIQLEDNTVNQNTTSGYFLDQDIANNPAILTNFYGVYGEASGLQPNNLKTINNGGSFYARSAQVNFGVRGRAEQGGLGDPNFIGVQNIGGQFEGAYGSQTATGVVCGGTQASLRNYGVSGFASSPTTPSQVENVGGQFSGANSANDNMGVKAVGFGGNRAIGVYGTASGATTNWAGYFDGDIFVSGTYVSSDENLKENIADLLNADSMLQLLNPVTFDFRTDEYPQLNLQDGNQMGLIAQQVELIFPELVTDNSSIAEYDSLGNITIPSVNFKTVDYTKLIPLLIAGHQGQALEIEAKDSIINDLNERLSNLENCLSGILPLLCQLSQNAIEANTPEAQELVRKNLNVTLNNRSTIILDQNVPNPFAEQTIINFSIPASVVKAQIHFYDVNGRIIQTLDLAERGLGSITVFGADLSSGTYTYTLVADGQIVATKKMVKQ